MTDNQINPDQVCPDCFRTMDIITVGTEGRKYFVCPVCHPDKKEESSDE